MKARNFKKELALVVPVSALRTKKSCGVGEFLDLIELAKFCKKAKISLIQILPVNDSGYDASPYNLVSAFALNPVYISLEKLEGAKKFLPEIKALRKNFDALERVAYQEVLKEKIKLARKIFESQKEVFTKELKDTNSEVAIWLAENSWIKSYTIFKNIKKQNFQSSWQCWTSMRNPTKDEIEIAWNCPAFDTEFNFSTWLQFNLHKQFLEAATFINAQGIMLKGDLPIMLNEDSCDVWANPELFRSDLKAGTPPDFENKCGQNWGFPCYFWQNHKETNYRWWKERLKKSEQYYNAFRLDHILGFFRVWAIPKGETTACLGRMIPYTQITTNELRKLGFSFERIRWMSEPHITTQSIMQVNNNDYLNSHGELHKVAERIGNEELWIFKSKIKAELDLTKYNLKSEVEKVLREKWLDRMLIKINEKNSQESIFTVAWNFQNTTAWASFSEEEKAIFLDLYEAKNAKSEKDWEAQGQEILTSLLDGISMQAFAEDLGMIPDCVPKVLENLEIFSLKVIRWEREWEKANKPFIPLANYKTLSLTTPATHDTSLLSTWWNEKLSLAEKLDLLKALNIDDTSIAQENLTPEYSEILLKAIFNSPSKVVAFQIQEFLNLLLGSLNFSSNSRINIPGTVNEFNWTYRIPYTIEELSANKSFVKKIVNLQN